MPSVHYLSKPPTQTSHILRVGFQKHTLADRLRTENKLAPKHMVFDAGNVAAQKGTVQELLVRGDQVILDTNAAEQSVPAGIAVQLQKLLGHKKIDHLKRMTLLPEPTEVLLSHFLDKNVRTAQSKAGHVQNLKSASEKIRKMSVDSAIGLARFYGALEVTAAQIGNIEFAPEFDSKVLKKEADRGMEEKS